MKKILTLLGVGSSLRRGKSKRLRLCKSGDLLLTRRSEDATPSEGIDVGAIPCGCPQKEERGIEVALKCCTPTSLRGTKQSKNNEQ